jgi:release factor glutamine methyltransferase
LRRVRKQASLARENLSRLKLQDRATVFEGSWADWADWQTADLVISNPPYIASSEIAGLAPEVRAYDPVSALDGGEDGLLAYREIVELARVYLKPVRGWFSRLAMTRRKRYPDCSSWQNLPKSGPSKDLGGNDRAVWGRKPESDTYIFAWRPRHYRIEESCETR